MKKIWNVKILLIFFFIFVIICTIISDYIYQRSLVKVELTLQTTGTLIWNASGQSVVEYYSNYKSVLNDIETDEKTNEEIEYVSKFELDGKVDFLFLNDYLQLVVPAIRNKEITGKIIHMDYSENSTTILVKFSDDDDLINQAINFSALKESYSMDGLLPLNAVNKDEDGTYVYIVKDSNGAWGKVYTAERVTVECRYNDDKNVVVYPSKLDYPVIINNGQELYNEMKVRFYP